MRPCPRLQACISSSPLMEGTGAGPTLTTGDHGWVQPPRHGLDVVPRAGSLSASIKVDLKSCALSVPELCNHAHDWKT